MTTTTINRLERFFRSAWLVFASQAILACALFPDTWATSQPLSFSDLGDGTKNLYTLHTYLRDAPEDWFGFEAMNAPFGESLWYTDATPVVAIAFRLLHGLGIPAGWLSTRGFNLFLLLSIALSSVFLYLLLKRANVKPWTAWILALTLPWISPQLLRLSAGHFNLSLGWLILGAWWWLAKWEEAEGNGKWGWIILSTLWTVLAAGFHLYYLPMLALMTGIWMVASGWYHRRAPRMLGERMSLAVAVPLISGLLVVVWMQLTDPFLDLRGAARGYNWGAWNLNLDSLVIAYQHLPMAGVPGLKAHMEIETHVYLGGFVIWSMIVGLIWVLAAKFVKAFPPILVEQRPRWSRALQWSGWLCLLLATGEYVRTFGSTVNFDNWLHPFKILRLISEDITQFRCLGRFGWPVYWGAAFGAGLLWDRMWKSTWGVGRIAFFLLFIPLITDSIGQINEVRHNLTPDPLAAVTKAPEIPSDILREAQGILPLPYYHVGSEVLDLTIDPVTEWERLCLQTALQLDLPLMSCKMSRTPPAQAREMLDWIIGGPPPSALSDQPVLVMKSLDPYSWSLPPVADRKLAREAFEAGKTLPEDWSLTEVARSGQVVWYLWEPFSDR